MASAAPLPLSPCREEAAHALWAKFDELETQLAAYNAAHAAGSGSTVAEGGGSLRGPRYELYMQRREAWLRSRMVRPATAAGSSTVKVPRVLPRSVNSEPVSAAGAHTSTLRGTRSAETKRTPSGGTSGRSKAVAVGGSSARAALSRSKTTFVGQSMASSKLQDAELKLHRRTSSVDSTLRVIQPLAIRVARTGPRTAASSGGSSAAVSVSPSSSSLTGTNATVSRNTESVSELSDSPSKTTEPETEVATGTSGRVRKRWGAPQKPLLLYAYPIDDPQKDGTKGFKKLLNFVGLSKVTQKESTVDISSPRFRHSHRFEQIATQSRPVTATPAIGIS